MIGLPRVMAVAQILAMRLGLTVDGLLKQLARGMSDVVPLLVDERVVDTEISGEVNDGDATLEEERRARHCRGMRDGEEDDIALVRDVGVVEPRVHEVGRSGKGRIDLCEGQALVRIGNGAGELEPRMGEQNPHGLDAGIPAGSNNSSSKHEEPPESQ